MMKYQLTKTFNTMRAEAVFNNQITYNLQSLTIVLNKMKTDDIKIQEGTLLLIQDAYILLGKVIDREAINKQQELSID